MPESPLALLDKPFRFSRVGESIAGDLRPQWRIAVILLILNEASRGSTSSMAKLHLITWMVRQPYRWELFEEILEGSRRPFGLIVRYEPALVRAIELALGEGLVEFLSGARVKLTDRGQKGAEEIVGSEALIDELEFLRKSKSHLTEKRINALLEWKH